jgi:hypothetical protein
LDRNNETIGPLERRLRDDYLRMATEEANLLAELSKPPDMIGEAVLDKILWAKQKQIDRQFTYLFRVLTKDGEKISVQLEDMKVDCPLVTAQYILDKPKLREDEALYKWAKACKDKAGIATQLMRASKRRFFIEYEDRDLTQVSCC